MLRRRLVWAVLSLAFVGCSALAGAQAGSGNEKPTASETSLPPGLEQSLDVAALLGKLKTLQESGQDSSLEALSLRQQLLERVLSASFDVDSALARIDNEASYVSEKRYLLEQKNQHKAAVLNLVTFAAAGALGAAGSAMQLTAGLNHAGTALQAAAGGTALVLAGAQLKPDGSKQVLDSPYNMLAQVLDQAPNGESQYAPFVLAYLNARRPDGQSTAAELTAAWRRLGRLKEGSKKGGTPVEDLVADRTAAAKLTVDELADREAMLHDLHALIATLHADLQQVLQQIESAHVPMTH